VADYVEWRECWSTFPESEDARLDPTASSLYLSMVLGGELDESESPRIEGLLLAPLRNEFAADSRWLANRDGVCREGVKPNPSHGMAAKRAIRTDALNILSVGPALSSFFLSRVLENALGLRPYALPSDESTRTSGTDEGAEEAVPPAPHNNTKELQSKNREWRRARVPESPGI